MKYYLYTDGSANNFSPYGEGGYAYIITNKDKQIISQFSEGELHATNNTMELKAIIKGCKAIEDGAEVIVVSDSQYALNVLSGKWKAKANLDLIREHFDKSQKLKIKYTWVKGHNGDELNEMVDQLAQDETYNMRKRYGIPKFDYTNSPKAKSPAISSPKMRLDKPQSIIQSKSQRETYYIHVETAMKDRQCYGAFSVFNSAGDLFAVDANKYECRTEPRLRLMVLYDALCEVPKGNYAVIASDDSYLKFAVGDSVIRQDTFNSDYINKIRSWSQFLNVGFIHKPRLKQANATSRELKYVLSLYY